MLYHVGRFEESKFEIPDGFEKHSLGYKRVSLVDHSIGSVHTGLGICQLEANGWVEYCVWANEKGIYVLQGELEMLRGKEAFRLGTDDYALIPYGVAHAFRNTGKLAARWIEVQAPQPKPPGAWDDKFFRGDVDWPKEIVKPDPSNPSMHMVGHFEEQRPIYVKGLGMQGPAVYRFMEEEFGAHHFYMMRGKLEIGGGRGVADHPVEESYFVLSGEVEKEIEGKKFRMKAVDFAWAGVGACHSSVPKGDVPYRWIETQAPQFPKQHGARTFAVWDKLRTPSSR